MTALRLPLAGLHYSPPMKTLFQLEKASDWPSPKLAVMTHASPDAGSGGHVDRNVDVISPFTTNYTLLLLIVDLLHHTIYKYPVFDGRI